MWAKKGYVSSLSFENKLQRKSWCIPPGKKEKRNTKYCHLNATFSSRHQHLVIISNNKETWLKYWLDPPANKGARRYFTPHNFGTKKDRSTSTHTHVSHSRVQTVLEFVFLWLLSYFILTYFSLSPFFSRDSWGRRHSKIVAIDAQVFRCYTDQFQVGLLKRELDKVQLPRQDLNQDHSTTFPASLPPSREKCLFRVFRSLLTYKWMLFSCRHTVGFTPP